MNMVLLPLLFLSAISSDTSVKAFQFLAPHTRTIETRLFSVEAIDPTRFRGTYPPLAPDDFADALLLLTPSDEDYDLERMVRIFSSLDAEMVRSTLTEPQQNMVDELWRVTKLVMNGSTRQEALAARRAPATDPKTAAVYGDVLRILDPSSGLSSSADLNLLTRAFLALDQMGEKTAAQAQVVDQLSKVIGRAVSYPERTVEDAIRKTWEDREQMSRSRLE